MKKINKSNIFKITLKEDGYVKCITNNYKNFYKWRGNENLKVSSDNNNYHLYISDNNALSLISQIYRGINSIYF